MSNLSEEEIINSITPIVNARKTHKDDNLYSLHLNAYQLDVLQGLLDLYCSKTEQLETAMNSLKEEKEKNKELEFKNRTRILGKYGEVSLEDLVKDKFISKDKIKEIIYPTPTNPISYEIQTSDIYRKILQLEEE